jgi:hypothetical protein
MRQDMNSGHKGWNLDAEILQVKFMLFNKKKGVRKNPTPSNVLHQRKIT